jgi:hypothetical protein
MPKVDISALDQKHVQKFQHYIIDVCQSIRNKGTSPTLEAQSSSLAIFF